MRSIIDRDIAQLEESIRALKSRRNELSLISRLPVEILCNIFKFSLVDVDDFFPSAFPGLMIWINFNFSQVSQHWRSTALSAPELWCKISLSYPRRWVQEMLIRSKRAKLTIHSCSSFDTSNIKAIEKVRSCLYEMDRVEELKLTLISGLKLEEIFWDLPKSAPQLHTLYIGCTTTFSIHEDLLHEAERLQRVELFNCKISWDSRLLTGLTCLSLQKPLNANAESSITQFLHALQRMPALTDLRLIKSIPDNSEGLSTFQVVDLPCLRVLHISSGVATLTTVLRHITIPHSALLNLTCSENQSGQIDFSNFLSVLAAKFLSSLVIRNLSLQVFDDLSLKFNLSTTEITQDRFPSSLINQSQLQLLFTWPVSHPRNHWHVKALTSAFDAMNLSFLTQLQLPIFDFIDPPTWAKTFGTLPLLNRVCVRGSAANSFLDALVCKAKEAEKSETAYHNVSFPNLRHIHLEGTNFGENSISVDKLLDCLMERCERKAEVWVLYLDDCECVSYDVVVRLGEVVVDVRWDGIMQGLTDAEIDYDTDGNTIDSDDMDHDYDEFRPHRRGFW